MFDWDPMKNKIILADNKDVMKDIIFQYIEKNVEWFKSL